MTDENNKNEIDTIETEETEELKEEQDAAEEAQEAEELEEADAEAEQHEEEDDRLALPMIPLRGLTVFPNMVLHFDIGREKSINALEKAMVLNQYIFLSAQKDESTDLPTPEDFYHIGTIGNCR